ncbi:hypothetical protein [Nocardia sp. NPDC019395]|uniref:hypothetical protein n=1 Tax=Nocardia sp. NPDC019395 TaxID=3154686 RepID=UPI0034072348
MADDLAPGTCPRCGEPIDQPDRGRPRKWCSDYCRRRANEEGVRIHEVVRTREVRITERVSTERQIARLLDDPDATELLLRTLAHRWRHTDIDAETRRLWAPKLLDIWQAFHARTDPRTAKNPPSKAPTKAEEFRLAIDRVLSSPRATATVLARVTDRFTADELRPGTDGAVLDAVAYLAYKARRLVRTPTTYTLPRRG